MIWQEAEMPVGGGGGMELVPPTATGFVFVQISIALHAPQCFHLRHEESNRIYRSNHTLVFFHWV